MAKQKLRIRQPGQHALLNPSTGMHETPKIDDYYEESHPLVRAHRWAFGSDAEIAEQVIEDKSRASVPVPQVEAATAAPGERRMGTRRP